MSVEQARSSRRPATSGVRKRKLRLLPSVALVLGACTFLLACLLLLPFVAPHSAAANLAPVSWAPNARALSLLATGDARPEVIAEAERETRAVLALSPTDAGAWSRLAYIDLVRNGALGPEGRLALERTYQVAPLGPGISRWRIQFALENWGELSPDLRRSVEYEVRALWRRDRGFLRDLRRAVANREGRLQLARLMARLQLQDSERARAK